MFDLLHVLYILLYINSHNQTKPPKTNQTEKETKKKYIIMKRSIEITNGSNDV